MNSPSAFERSTADSRVARNASNDALGALEKALAAPTPGREPAWLDDVAFALDRLSEALDDQSVSDLGEASLLSEIGRDQPRLLPRIERLHGEHQMLRASASSLQAAIASAAGHRDPEWIDVADVRDRLAELARRFRVHRARESDLVYEAIAVDLGGGD